MLNTPGKRRLFLITAIISSLLLITGYAIYGAIKHENVEYHRLLGQDEVQLLSNGHQFVEHLLDLQNRARMDNTWQASFTIEQINGWVATHLLKKYPGLLPKELKNPRLILTENHFRIYCQYQGQPIHTDVLIEFELAMSNEPNEIAITLHRVNAGAWPLSLDNAVQEIRKFCRKNNLPNRWSQNGGQPMALITVPDRYKILEGKQLTIEALSIAQETITVSGTTESDVSQE